MVDNSFTGAASIIFVEFSQTKFLTVQIIQPDNATRPYFLLWLVLKSFKTELSLVIHF